MTHNAHVVNLSLKRSYWLYLFTFPVLPLSALWIIHVASQTIELSTLYYHEGLHKTRICVKEGTRYPTPDVLEIRCILGPVFPGLETRVAAAKATLAQPPNNHANYKSILWVYRYKLCKLRKKKKKKKKNFKSYTINLRKKKKNVCTAENKRCDSPHKCRFHSDLEGSRRCRIPHNLRSGSCRRLVKMKDKPVVYQTKLLAYLFWEVELQNKTDAAYTARCRLVFLHVRTCVNCFISR